jgi:hypothetical protein
MSNKVESKPILVFLPGVGADHRLFKYQMAAFRNSYAVDWIDPLPHESLEQYAVRLAETIRFELNKRPSAPVTETFPNHPHVANTLKTA